MRILYISPLGTKTDPLQDPRGEKPFDFDLISSTIIEGVTQAFDGVELTKIQDIYDDKFHVNINEVEKHELYLCDLTTSNPNVTYIAGLVEGIGKPIIYFISSESSITAALMSSSILSYSEASLKNEFRDELNKLIRLAEDDPQKFSNKRRETKTSPKAFISYSHYDKLYLDRLMVHLKPLAKQGLLDIWVDTQLKTGDLWQAEIEKALNESSIAILMISADFMASDFIVDNELPPLLSKAQVTGTKIIPVILSPCRFDREPSLSRFQAVNPPHEPLSGMENEKRETIYDKLAQDIEKALKNT